MEEYHVVKKEVRKRFKVGMRVADSEGNEFVITEFRKNDDPFMWDGIVLKSRSGEIEIASNDLLFYTLVFMADNSWEKHYKKLGL